MKYRPSNCIKANELTFEDIGKIVAVTYQNGRVTLRGRLSNMMREDCLEFGKRKTTKYLIALDERDLIDLHDDDAIEFLEAIDDRNCAKEPKEYGEYSTDDGLELMRFPDSVLGENALWLTLSDKQPGKPTALSISGRPGIWSEIVKEYGNRLATLKRVGA